MVITKTGLRKAWFQIHKWTGLLLAIAIIPLSVTGAALVWHDGLDDWLNPQRVVTGAPTLAASAYANAAGAQLAAGEKLASIELRENGAVVVGAARPLGQNDDGRPVRTILWLAPGDAKLLDRAASDAGPIRVMHAIHGSLMIPGWGRSIVGWVGAAMLTSSLSGIWLWWPTVGRWIKGFRWRRHRNLDTNLHHLFGFWIAIPLFILSATGVWISFPKVFAGFDKSVAEGRGTDARSKTDGKVSGRREREPSREQRFRAKPMTSPAIALDRAVALAADAAPGRIARIGWPTDIEPQWTFAIGPEARAAQTEVRIDAATGEPFTKPPSNEPESLARLMRRIHDGTDMGMGWQILIFLGGLLPAILSITGLIMWWRARTWRKELRSRGTAKSVYRL